MFSLLFLNETSYFNCRKRILQTMISDPEKLTDDMVNELNNCEIEIVFIKQQIRDQQTAVQGEFEIYVESHYS